MCMCLLLTYTHHGVSCQTMNKYEYKISFLKEKKDFNTVHNNKIK